MNTYYKKLGLIDGKEQNCILRLPKSAFIPFDPANTDYQEYLAWLAEGNEPEPADEPPQEEPPAT